MLPRSPRPPRQPRKEPTQRPYLVFQPATYKSMQRGINLLVGAIRPTLGPKSRLVAVEKALRKEAPELLDDGGTIARRIIGLQDKDADMGAMMLRQVLWRVHEKVGDGTASTAVIFKSIFDQGVHYITSGGNSMRLRGFLEDGEKVILDELDQMRTEIQGKAALAKVAEAVCYDQPLAQFLGEIVDIVGEYGFIEIRKSNTRDYSREYVEGMYWSTGVASRDMVTDPIKHMVELENVSVFISDLAMNDPQALIPLLDTALKNEVKDLLLIGTDYSGPTLALIFAANKSPEKLRVVAEKTPGLSSIDQATAMQDFAVLTGGKALVKAAGNKLDEANLDYLGKARKARAGYDFFSIIGGKGDARQLREHLASLKNAVENQKESYERKKLQERLGKLMGGAATLYVPGSTETEITAKKELAERCANTVRAALREGVVPGGGVALLNCRQPLRDRMTKAVDEDEKAAYRILVRAMEAPIRALLDNSGEVVDEVMAEIRLAGAGFGFDVMTRRIANMSEVGIYDVAAAVKCAVGAAVSGAALALTTDVLLHRRKVQQTFEP